MTRWEELDPEPGMLEGAIADTAAGDEYGDAEDEVAVGEASVLDDVVRAEDAGEVDEIVLEE